MPCVCGNKVERTQPKVHCAKCNELYHLECVKVRPADLEYLHKTGKEFICAACVAARRNSLRSPPPIINLNDSNVNSSAIMITHQNSNNNTAGANSENIELFNSLKFYSTKQSTALQYALDEISSLKEENNSMVDLINSQRPDNNSLCAQSESLIAEVRSVQSQCCFDELRLAISSLRKELELMRNVKHCSCFHSQSCVYYSKSDLNSLLFFSADNVNAQLTPAASTHKSTSMSDNNTLTSVGVNASDLTSVVKSTHTSSSSISSLAGRNTYAGAANSVSVSNTLISATVSSALAAEPKSTNPDSDTAKNIDRSPAQWTKVQRKKLKNLSNSNVKVKNNTNNK
ncbi:GATA zinc finger domain-containing protein 8 isoform X1 [Eurosta solidaginis]|uniref:GATA zinc finger domain-containing protein 8 isoform X1 n=1 Tax=Eurosta solidaginis TaxID=178769 RepID=UPI0035313EC7